MLGIKKVDKVQGEVYDVVHSVASRSRVGRLEC